MRDLQVDATVSAPLARQPAAGARVRARRGFARVNARVAMGLATGGLVLGGAAIVGVATLAESRGRTFFEVGQSLERMLRRTALAARARDEATFGAAFSDAYAGVRLGLIDVVSIESRGGVQSFRIGTSRPAPALASAASTAAAPSPAPEAAALADPTTRADVLREWVSYLAQFDTIDEVRLEVDRIESWHPSTRPVATARFELIGRLRGAARSSIDRARFRFAFDGVPGSPRIVRASLIDGERFASDRALFRDVAPDAGVAFEHAYYPDFLNQPIQFATIRHGPGGISAADYDRDGFYDLFVPDGVQSRLLRNRGDGTFDDVTSRVGLVGLDGVSVGVFADYDNDGRDDLFVSRTFRPNQLFRQRGDGTFEDVTSASGLGADCCTTAASWADYDNDGLLDLYVCRYLDPRVRIPTTFFYARNGEPNQLYRNTGRGTFTNVTARAGVGDPGLCLGSVWGDYDDDRFPDVYVVNDFGRSTLYHNNRDGTFTDVTVASNTLAYGAGMNASMADYDNDGRLDLYTTDIRSDSAWLAETPTVHWYLITALRQGVWRSDMPLYWEMFRQSGLGATGVFQKMASGNTLLRNNGDGTFEDTTKKANANPPGWFWGASFADFDNDGWQDVYAADGWIHKDRDTEIELTFLHAIITRQADYKTGRFFQPGQFGTGSWHGYERNRYLRNNGNGTFTEIGHATNTDLALNSRGVAVADFWNRGRLDIAVSASHDRHALLRNEIDGGHWLGVELVGTQSNRNAVGARLIARTANGLQIREVVLGDGYGSQNSLRQYFGLGTARTIDELTIRWPRSGIVQTFHHVAVDRIVEIVEGRDALVEWHPPAAAVTAASSRASASRRTAR